jgi:cytochrome P450
MIGKMVAMLLADRRHWERLLAEPALVRTAVGETLRMDANSGFGMVRYLPVETEVADSVLPKGTTVLCGMAAANRDESAFDHAAGPGELVKLEGLIVGGLTEVPVRW